MDEEEAMLKWSPEPEPTWKECVRRGPRAKKRSKAKAKGAAMPEADGDSMVKGGKASPESGRDSLVEGDAAGAEDGDAAGDAESLSFHAMIMAEMEAQGCIARPDAEVDRDGDRDGGLECERGLHHLHYDRVKGWMLRVTVDLGKNVIGKRLKFRLRTRDAEEAEKSRDLVLATLKKLGLTVRLRMHRRGR